MENLTNVTTGEVKLSYVHLFKPYAAQPGQEEKYSVTILVPKTDTATMGRISGAIDAAKQRGISEKWNGQCPPIVPTPIHDGDGVRPSDGMPFGDECKGHWVFTASAKVDYPPEVVDKMGNPIINQSEIYSGIYGRVNVNFYPYSFGGKKGVGAGLGPVQKLRDGEALSGGSMSAAQAFGTPPQPIQQGFTNAPQGVPQPAQPVQSNVPWNQSPAQPVQQTTQMNPITGLPY